MAQISDEEEELILHDYNPEVTSGSYFHPNNCFSSSLHAAIAGGNIEAAKKLILEGRELNLTDARGYSALHLAVEYSRVDILKLMLAQPGIRCNTRNNHGETPLFLSLENSINDELASVLIDNSCNIHIPNCENVTPLHLAVRRKTTDIGLKLIRKGADVNSKDLDGYTPLHEAATKNQFDNVCMLLYFNASADETTTYSGATPFHMACTFDYATETARYLMNYTPDINECDDTGYSPLHIALACRSDLALDIIERGADVNEVRKGYPMIYFSLLYQTSEIFEIMWPKINVDILLNLSYPLLQMLMSEGKFPPEQFLKCFYMVFESPYIDALITQYMTYCEESLFSCIAHKKLPLEERIKLNYLLLSHGVSVHFNDICIMHERYGFDESVQLILTSGCCIQPNRTNRFNLLVSRICYDNIDICPHTSCRKRYDEFYSVRKCATIFCDIGRDGYPECCRRVPTLLELSRDAVRANVYKTCSKPFVFNVYNAFKSLNVPKQIRDILFLKRPIYPGNTIHFC